MQGIIWQWDTISWAKFDIDLQRGINELFISQPATTNMDKTLPLGE